MSIKICNKPAVKQSLLAVKNQWNEMVEWNSRMEYWNTGMG